MEGVAEHYIKNGDLPSAIGLLRAKLKISPLSPRANALLRKCVHLGGVDPEAPPDVWTYPEDLRAKHLANTLENLRAKKGVRIALSPEKPSSPTAHPSHPDDVERVLSAKSDCDVLRLSHTCSSPKEASRAYRQLALATHPDRNSHPMAAAAFNRVCAAYERLTTGDGKFMMMSSEEVAVVDSCLETLREKKGTKIHLDATTVTAVLPISSSFKKANLTSTPTSPPALSPKTKKVNITLSPRKDKDTSLPELEIIGRTKTYHSCTIWKS